VIRQILAALTVLVVTLPAVAHHSFSMFDFNRPSTVHGTVRAFQWANPHVWVWIVSDDPASNGVTFAIETSSTNELSRFHGWTKRALNDGDKVTVDYVPLRSGKNGGSAQRITLANGRVLLDTRPPTRGAHNP
jgi:hypothetical protein